MCGLGGGRQSRCTLPNMPPRPILVHLSCGDAEKRYSVFVVACRAFVGCRAVIEGRKPLLEKET